MRLPYVNAMETSQSVVSTFVGYQHIDTPPAGAFYDTKNVTCDAYPVLSPRQPRVLVKDISTPGGLYAKGQLAWVSGTSLYYGGALAGTVTSGQKQFVGMGAYLLIWPDKKVFNTVTKELNSLENHWSNVGNVSYTLTRLDGDDYTYYTGTSAPSTTSYTYWLDTSNTPHVLKMWNASEESWVSVGTTYVKIGATGIGSGLEEYDVVTISGSSDDQFNTDMAVYERGDNYIKVAALIDQNFVQSASTGTVKVDRNVPDMEYLTECNNRVWGCNSNKNEIYACALGDPTNWYKYMGLSNDSYAVEVGSDGPFTGAVTHGGYVLFFKEDCLHKVYGTMPSNYQTNTVVCRGVQKGSASSLKVVNETLYYKSRHDVCSYDGSLPVSISSNLGTNAYFNAVGGALGSKYYLCMKDKSGKPTLFTYDTERQLWCKEDDLYLTHMAPLDGDLFGLDSTGALWCLNGRTYFYDSTTNVLGDDEPVKWSATTGQIGISSMDAKYINRLQVRVWLPAGSMFCVEVDYDGKENWKTVANMDTKRDRSVFIPILVKRCDRMQLRFSGIGDCKLYSIAFVSTTGSEVR